MGCFNFLKFVIVLNIHDRLAQLVERYIDIVEATSSSLVSVTEIFIPAVFIVEATS